MVEQCRRWAESRTFQGAVLALIVLNAVVMGLETWPTVTARWGGVFEAVHAVVQAAFVAELAVRLAAHARAPLGFFRSGWNVFDLAVVSLSLLPVAGPLATVARLARVLRAARLVTGLPELRSLIGAMLRSIPSMGHVVVLASLLVYVYGVVGHHLFAAVDPAHWGTLGRAAQTLFFVITLEGWVDILRASEAATPWAWVYYVSFIVLGVFVVINLFIAVVLGNLEKARREETGEAAEEAAARAELRAMAAELARLRSALESRS